MVLTIRLLDTLFSIDGPDDLIRALSLEYHGGILGSLSGAKRITWEGLKCCVDGLDAPIEVHHEDLISDVTRIMIRRVIAKHNPGVLLLHGNAIVHNGRTIIFAGESGSGKSTLSIECIDTLCPNAALLAEDLVIIDPESGRVYPHPRASRLKTENGEHFVRHRSQAIFPASINDGHVIFLRRSEGGETAKSITSISLCGWTETASRIVSRVFDGSVAVDLDGKAPQLRFSSPVSPQLVGQLREELEPNGILVMAIHHDAPIQVIRERPSSPRMDRLDIPDALRAAMSQLVAPLPVMGGGLMIAMAKALSGSKCWTLTPGGSPRETVNSFLETLSAA